MKRPALYGLIISVMIQIVMSQGGGMLQPKQCFDKQGYYFCNHNDTSVKKARADYAFLGWCCPIEVFGTGSTQCNPDESAGIECTLPRSDPNDQGMPLYMTYWPGMVHETHCNSTSPILQATTER